ncbi:MAG: hypothetical protein SGI83_12935 [Bacteroidota bacterium]|nr:hypothetical protein [Bacteroidota bacterium]
MKKMQLLSAALIFTVAATMISCKPSKVWATKDRDRDEKVDRNRDRDRDERVVRNDPAPPPASRYYSSTPLIISPTPGFIMNKSTDGRYYHRTRQGILYWKGYDDRFFLDRSYMSRVNYSSWEYDQWKRYSRAR